MNVALLYNAPTLPQDHPDAAQEWGVLESVTAFERALLPTGHDVRRVSAGHDVRQLIDDLLPRGTAPRPDVVVNFCESFAGRTAAEPWVAGLLDLLNLPYTGSPPECLGLVRNKARTKSLLQGAGLPTADFVVIDPGAAWPEEALARLLAAGPVIVKPAAEDASLGIGPDSVVTDRAGVARQAAEILQQYGPALVERYLPGREFNVSVIGLPEATVLPLAEIMFEPDPLLPWQVVTYDAKWLPESGPCRHTSVVCPAEISPALAERLRDVARRAFMLCGCRHYARVDLRVDQRGEPFVLEVNGNPDLDPTAGLAKALRAAGWEYERFVEKLVTVAAGMDVAAGCTR